MCLPSIGQRTPCRFAGLSRSTLRCLEWRTHLELSPETDSVQSYRFALLLGNTLDRFLISRTAPPAQPPPSAASKAPSWPRNQAVLELANSGSAPQ